MSSFLRNISENRLTGVSRLMLLAALATVAYSGADCFAASPALEKDPAQVAALLTAADTWILPQPKEAGRIEGSFDLKRAQGIEFLGDKTPEVAGILDQFAVRLKTRSGVELKTVEGASGGRIVLGLFPDGKPGNAMHGIGAEDLTGLGGQGYAIHIDSMGVSAAATAPAGLRYAAWTISQIAADRTVLPGLHLRDWPSLTWRGVTQDICRGQVPHVDTFKRLAGVLAEGKLNIQELYIEHTFKFKAHPDISPPEGLTPEEAREIFNAAAQYGIDLHPLFQVLGHAGSVLNKPKYVHMAVRPLEHSWEMSYDIRKPETVNFVLGMIRELNEAMPGKFFVVDITENDAKGFNESGTSNAELGKLIYEYMLKIRANLKPAGTRLMPTQYSLDAEGYQGGLGAHLKTMPRDIVIGSYYTARPNVDTWRKDFPRMQKEGVDFFAQAWIYSHVRLMPWVTGAADFSDYEISKGLPYGVLGSISSAWGDEGHFHFVGQEWQPFLYHGASAWTGAKVDRNYFDRAFCKLFYGMPDDQVAAAYKKVTDIYSLEVSYRDQKSDKVIVGDPQNIFLYGFIQSPWGQPCDTVTDPAAVGKAILDAADPAVAALEKAMGQATRNKDNIKQILFGARCIQAMGRKFTMRAHDLDKQYPREKVKAEIEALIKTYEQLLADYKRLWQAEDRENDQFRAMCGWFNNTIAPCQNRLDEIKKGK